MPSDLIAYSARVPELSQADFMRGVRGEKVVPGQTPVIEPILGGISSISRAAVRRVHQESAADAQAYFSGGTAKFVLMGDRAAATVQTYSRSVGRYIEWDSEGADADLDLKLAVPFGPGDRVRAIAHVVLDADNDQCEARVLLWDDLPLSTQAAEMIALPVLECAESERGSNSVVAVEVWHLARGEKERVVRSAALARRSDVESFFASL